MVRLSRKGRNPGRKGRKADPDWRGKEKELLSRLKERLDSHQWGWLNGSVQLTAPDLATVDTDTLKVLFPPRPPEKPPGVNDAELIRTFIWQTWVKTAAGIFEPLLGNIRSFWYAHLEEFYRRHGLVKSRLLSLALAFRLFDGALGRWPSEDLEVLEAAIREEKVTETMTEQMDLLVGHRVFRFQDEFGFREPMDNRRHRGRNRPRFLFFTEKEGLWWLCETLYAGLERPGKEALPSISVMASNGQPSFLTLEYFARQLQGVSNLVVGAFCDHDPWGLSIAEQIDSKLRFLGFRVVTYRLTTVDLFTPEQIQNGRNFSSLDPEKGLGKQVHNWFLKTGGTEGQKIGLHIDVIPNPKKIQRAKSWLEALVADRTPPFPVIAPVPFPECCGPGA